jgi:hypothetical protein
MGRDSTFCELEGILFCWYLAVRASCIPVDGNILCEKTKQVADRMQIDNFAVSYGWICGFSRPSWPNTKLHGASAPVETGAGPFAWEATSVMKGYEPRDIYSCLWLECWGQSCPGGWKCQSESSSAAVCEQWWQQWKDADYGCKIIETVLF